jgi:hypothetical protein
VKQGRVGRQMSKAHVDLAAAIASIRSSDRQLLSCQRSFISGRKAPRNSFARKAGVENAHGVLFSL